MPFLFQKDNLYRLRNVFRHRVNIFTKLGFSFHPFFYTLSFFLSCTRTRTHFTFRVSFLIRFDWKNVRSIVNLRPLFKRPAVFGPHQVSKIRSIRDKVLLNEEPYIEPEMLDFRLSFRIHVTRTPENRRYSQSNLKRDGDRPSNVIPFKILLATL